MRRYLPIVLLAVASPLAAQEKLPAGAKVVKIDSHPAKIDLRTPYAYSQLLLTAELDNGDRLDVTRMATIEKPATVKVSAEGQVRPVADGEGVLKISLAGQSTSVPVKVSGQKQPYEVSFVRDVMPILSRMGCNAGTCHGAEKGRNGFKLSLRGYDPVLDHRALTDDLEGRRFDRAVPDRSLMLLKATGEVPHVGGVLFNPGEPHYELIKSWISQGVNLDLKSPRVASIDISPRASVIPLPMMKQQATVIATYSDGSTRDVTAEAFIESSNTEVATADRQGILTAVRRGEATIMARYEGSYTAAPLVVMGDRSGYAWKQVPEYNFIDTLADEKMRQVKVLPSDLCTDAQFMRRVYIDLTGLSPEPAAIRAFLADKRDSRTKRAELVDKLIGSPDFVENWTNKWADLLEVNRKFLGEQGAAAFRDYIRKAVSDNMPYDKFAYSILTGTGSNLDSPAAAYYKIHREPTDVMENTTHLFLAVRFNCNKCHDHPFERWTQSQYYELSAFFAQVQRTEDPRFKGQKIGGTNVEGAKPLVEVIKDIKGGEVVNLRTGKNALPHFPYEHKDLAPNTASRREQLAKWVTSKDNVYFARSYVNRLWSYMMGVGLIEPVDDIRAGNPPTNPKLLDRLTEEFVKSGFDTRHMLKLMCTSRVYQQSVVTNQWNKDDTINYSHALARRLPAEALYDAIHRATGSQSKLPGLPPGSRAAQLLDSNLDAPGGFLDLFGRPVRESACECERVTGTIMLGPVLTMVNGPVVGDAIRDPNNRLTKLVAAEKDDAKVVEEMFLAFLGRLPTKREVEKGIQAIQDGVADYDDVVANYTARLETLKAYEKTLDAQQVKWEAEVGKAISWTTLDPATATATGGATLTKQKDLSLLAGGANPANDTYTVTVNTRTTGITAIRLEVMPDDSLPAKGPGRAGTNGNFVLNEFQVAIKEEGSKDKPKRVMLVNAQATFSQTNYPVSAAIDNNPATGWAIAPESGKGQMATFEFAQPIGFAKGTEITFTLIQKFGTQHTIGRFRLSVTTTKPPLSLKPLPEPVAKVLTIEPAKRTPEQKAEITKYYRSRDPQLLKLQQDVAEQTPPADKRLLGLQDLAWALMNTNEFLFNH
jgi:hypothetical protein